MNREIKFRGKRVDNGEWVYGYLVVDPKNNYRIYLKPFKYATSNTYYFVIPETVGQFTGLKDKNLNDIYEGDILKITDDFEGDFWFSEVDNKNGCFEVEVTKMDYDISPLGYLTDTELVFKIIGNIHENPELLKK